MPFLLLANYYSISPLQKRHGKEVQTTLIGNQNERMKLVARSRPRIQFKRKTDYVKPDKSTRINDLVSGSIGRACSRRGRRR